MGSRAEMNVVGFVWRFAVLLALNPFVSMLLAVPVSLTWLNVEIIACLVLAFLWQRWSANRRRNCNAPQEMGSGAKSSSGAPAMGYLWRFAVLWVLSLVMLWLFSTPPSAPLPAQWVNIDLEFA